MRSGLLRLVGFDIGAQTVIGGGIRIAGVNDFQRRFSIGTRSWVNAGCYFDVSERIDIGSNVAIAQGVLVLTQSHHLGDSSRRAGALVKAPVRIGDGCWIGARAVILPGVTIGRGAVVAAGAVVVSDVPPDTMVGGVPARAIKSLT
jgi:acetyltransferase-like isoleucine patch superfamily enzyme